MNPNILLVPILLPAIAGLIVLLLPKRGRIKEIITLIFMIITSAVSLIIFLGGETKLEIQSAGFPIQNMCFFDFIANHFSSFIMLACSLFGVLIVLYSIRQMESNSRLKEYYAYLLWTVAAANGAVLSDNLVLLIVFWGIVVVMLYLLITIGGPGSEKAAKKSFIIVGGSDFLMLLGAVIIFYLAKTIKLSEIKIPIQGSMAIFAFIFLMIGAITKAGAIPFHTWIPTVSQVAPVSVMAFLPAALDKLLGIYLLARIAMDLFVMNNIMGHILMGIGSITIIAAVMMALVQKNLKRLLAYHAVSQVGYMVLGIGTGIPVGIAGGLFHMLNNAIYKCCLFLCSGAVEYRTKTTKLEELGGLAKMMPVTFITCFIAAMSISGVPPFNGFVSKWMVYQGVIGVGGSIWPIFLVAAMFGSALTLASFIKVLHSTFLSRSPKGMKKVKEVGFSMKVPMIILASLCVIFGVFAQFPLRYLIGPISVKLASLNFGTFWESIKLTGVWSSTLATVLIIVSLIIGFFIYLIGNIKKMKESEIFVGGELIDNEEVRIPGTHFYSPIKSFFRKIYNRAEHGWFDIYILSKRAILPVVKNLRNAHSGILSLYIFWLIVGLILLLLVFIRF